MQKRIWTYYKGSPVRITLKVGEKITLDTGYQETEEGFDRQVHEYTLADDGIVHLECFSEGRDCDGYISNEDTYVSDGTVERDGLPMMAFEIAKRGPVFDQTAQSMGY